MLRKNSEYKINSYAETETKNGDIMAKLQLVDTATNEKFSCIIWEDFLARIEKRALKTGNIIAIIESDFNEKFNNSIIKQVKLIKETSIGLSEAEQQELFNKIIKTVNDFQNTKLKTAVLELINQNKEGFKIAPAARRHHHNYVGGLMLHIDECVEYAKALFPAIYAETDRELVLTGCIIHDFGKVFEYKVDLETGVIEIDEDWQKVWISHLHYGFSWAIERGFNELAHIIASHHGIKEHGALVEPDTNEAKFVYHVDWLSSRLGRISVEDLEVKI